MPQAAVVLTRPSNTSSHHFDRTKVGAMSYTAAESVLRTTLQALSCAMDSLVSFVLCSSVDQLPRLQYLPRTCTGVGGVRYGQPWRSSCGKSTSGWWALCSTTHVSAPPTRGTWTSTDSPSSLSMQASRTREFPRLQFWFYQTTVISSSAWSDSVAPESRVSVLNLESSFWSHLAHAQSVEIHNLGILIEHRSTTTVLLFQYWTS